MGDFGRLAWVGRVGVPPALFRILRNKHGRQFAWLRFEILGCAGQDAEHGKQDAHPTPRTVFMKLLAVTICINYADYLECVIENRRHFDRWMIVTVPTDRATHELCAKHGIECMDSAVLEADGRDFNAVDNKGPVLNEGMDALFWSEPQTGKSESLSTWMVVVDADVLLPRDFRQRVQALPLEAGFLYGMSGRKICETREQFETLRACEPWDVMAERNSQALGYFNLFCPDVRPDRCVIRSGESVWEHDDYLFTTSFAPERRRVLPFTAIHLGNYGKNWRGRVSGSFTLADGSTADLPASESAKSGVQHAAVLGYFPGGRWREIAGHAKTVYLVDEFEIHSMSGSAMVEADRAVLREKFAEETAGMNNLVLLWSAGLDAMAMVQDGSLDLLYIPGEVSPDMLRRVMPHWLPKLREGAMVCGDVYGLPHWGNATHSISLIFGPPDGVQGGRWWKKFAQGNTPVLAHKSVGVERGIVFVHAGSHEMEKLIVAVFAARKYWNGPIHVRNHGAEDEAMLIALARLGATVEWIGAQAIPREEMLWRACLGSRFERSLVLEREHLLMQEPSFRMEQVVAGLGQVFAGEEPFLCEPVGNEGSRRIAKVRSAQALAHDGGECDVLLCKGEPSEWSEPAWERWCEVEAETTEFLAREIRVAGDTTIVTIVTPEDAGDFQRNWLTWKFAKTPVVIVLVDVPLEGFWIPGAEAVRITEERGDSATLARVFARLAEDCKTGRVLFLSPLAAALPGAELWPDLPEERSGVHYPEIAREEPGITGNHFMPTCCFALIPKTALAEIGAGGCGELCDQVIRILESAKYAGKVEFADLSKIGWRFPAVLRFSGAEKFAPQVARDIIRPREDGLLQLADDVVVITLPERKDRQARVTEMMAKENLWFRFVPGVRVTDKDIEPFEISEVGKQNFKMVAGFEKYLRWMVGCRRAHLREFEAAKKAGLKSLLIIEDDAMLNEGWLENLQQALAELPPGWLQLHYSAADFRPATEASPHLKRLTGAYQTTAILYSEAGVEAALNCIRHSRSEIDHWMGNHLHPFGNSYIVNPIIAYQFGGVSDIMSYDRGVTR